MNAIAIGIHAVRTSAASANARARRDLDDAATNVAHEPRHQTSLVCAGRARLSRPAARAYVRRAPSGAFPMRLRSLRPVRLLARLMVLVAALIAARGAPVAVVALAYGSGEPVVTASDHDDHVTVVSAERAVRRAASRPCDDRLPRLALTPARAALPALRPLASGLAAPPPSAGAESVRIARRHIPRMESGEPPRA